MNTVHQEKKNKSRSYLQQQEENNYLSINSLNEGEFNLLRIHQPEVSLADSRAFRRLTDEVRREPCE